MKIIPLHPLEKGFFTIVDAEIFQLLTKIRWSVLKRYNGTGFDAIHRSRIKGTLKYLYINMARLITNAPSHLQVDHINRNPLDNRRANLRLATNQQNQFNRRLGKNNKSGFKGVVFHDSSGSLQKPWRAFIQINKKKKHIGYFVTPEEAALAYDKAAIKHYGEFAATNKSLGLL